jgi:hypothetical protein
MKLRISLRYRAESLNTKGYFNSKNLIDMKQSAIKEANMIIFPEVKRKSVYFFSESVKTGLELVNR